MFLKTLITLAFATALFPFGKLTISTFPSPSKSAYAISPPWFVTPVLAVVLNALSPVPNMEEAIVLEFEAIVVNVRLLLHCFPPVTTVIISTGAVSGTVKVIVVAVEAVTVALTEPINTTLLEGVALKLVPVIVTLVPAAPLAGLNEVIAGVGLANTDLQVNPRNKNKSRLRVNIFFMCLFYLIFICTHGMP